LSTDRVLKSRCSAKFGGRNFSKTAAALSGSEKDSLTKVSWIFGGRFAMTQFRKKSQKVKWGLMFEITNYGLSQIILGYWIPAP